MKGQHGKGLSG